MEESLTYGNKSRTRMGLILHVKYSYSKSVWETFSLLFLQGLVSIATRNINIILSTHPRIYHTTKWVSKYVVLLVGGWWAEAEKGALVTQYFTNVYEKRFFMVPWRNKYFARFVNLFAPKWVACDEELYGMVCLGICSQDSLNISTTQVSYSIKCYSLRL